MNGARAVRRHAVDAGLEVHVVFIRILPGDNQESAEKTAHEIFDGTDAHLWWDNDRTLGLELAPRFPIHPSPVAWDTYFFHEAGARWEAKYPEPFDWVHQLGGVKGDRFRGGKLESAIPEIVGRLKGESR